MADSVKVSFPKLGHNNWASWQQRMEWLLEKEDLWDVVDLAKPEPVTDEWKAKDRKARSNIGLSLEDSQFKFVKTADSARGMWNALKEQHEKASMSTIVHYLNILCSAKMQDSDNMQVHLDRMEDLFDKLDAAGQNLEESLQIAMIFRSVPSSYRSLVQSLQSRADEDWTVTLVKTRLLDEYNQRCERDESLSQSVKAMKMSASDREEPVCFSAANRGTLRSSAKSGYRRKMLVDPERRRLKTTITKRSKQKVTTVRCVSLPEKSFRRAG